MFGVEELDRPIQRSDCNPMEHFWYELEGRKPEEWNCYGCKAGVYSLMLLDWEWVMKAPRCPNTYTVYTLYVYIRMWVCFSCTKCQFSFNGGKISYLFLQEKTYSNYFGHYWEDFGVEKRGQSFVVTTLWCIVVFFLKINEKDSFRVNWIFPLKLQMFNISPIAWTPKFENTYRILLRVKNKWIDSLFFILKVKSSRVVLRFSQRW